MDTRRLNWVVAFLASAGGLAFGQEANFDGFPSGFRGQTFQDGGITFSDNLWFAGGLRVQFGTTNGTGSLSADPAFTPVNVMTTGSWSTGTTLGYTRTHQWVASTGETSTRARVDVWYVADTNWEGTEVSFEGLVGDEVVVRDSFIHPGQVFPPVIHRRMEIDGVPFERVRFICRGGTMPGELDGILAVFDNVAIEAGEVCAVDLDGDGELTLFDFLEFQNLFAAGDPRADMDGDGDLTLFDFLEFQNLFAMGCP